jgi:conjugal transfer/entry exclusion protein
MDPAKASLLADLSSDPDKFADALSTTIDSLAKVIKISEDLMKKLLPFERFKQISDGIQAELSQYGSETTEKAVNCAVALRHASELYKNATVPLRAYATAAKLITEDFVNDGSKAEDVPLLVHVVSLGLTKCDEAITKLRRNY